MAAISSLISLETLETIWESLTHWWWSASAAALAGWGCTLWLALILGVGVFHLIHEHRARHRFGGMDCCPFVTHPPEGRAWPWMGHALSFVRHRPWDLMGRWHQTFGSVYAFDLLGSTMFSLASPELIKIVLQSKIHNVKKDVGNTYKSFLSILGTGIVTSENQAWIKQRLKMSHPLRIDVLDMIPLQTLVAVQRWMEQLDAAAESNNSEHDNENAISIDLASSLRHLTLQVISGTFLSLSAEESDSTLAQFYLPIVDESNMRVWHPYRAYLWCLPAFWKNIYYVHKLNAYISGLIKQRWETRRRKNADSSSATDILDKMLAAVEKEYAKQQTATVPPRTLPSAAVRQLRDEMKTFLLAGHETSAAMMTWTLYELLANPKLLAQVAAEGQRIFDPTIDWANNNSAVVHQKLPNREQLNELKLAEASLKEALRKYSVVPVVARRTVQDLYLPVARVDENHATTGNSSSRSSSEANNNASDKQQKQPQHAFIPKGSTFFVNIQAVHHNPAYWPNPMRFDPTRFLDDSTTKPPRDPYTFLPFIAGPRNCLGQHLALLESKMVIALLTQRYHLQLAPGNVLEVDDWNRYDPRHRYMVPVCPQTELCVTVRRKQKKPSSE